MEYCLYHYFWAKFVNFKKSFVLREEPVPIYFLVMLTSR